MHGHNRFIVPVATITAVAITGSLFRLMLRTHVEIYSILLLSVSYSYIIINA